VTMPYFGLMVLALLLMWWFPHIVTWLPARM
jgi:TRAP-type mannitol/chloroaromatic compound transport system permease large subunit